MHGASTHFPIALLLASVIFDFLAWRSRDESLRRGLHFAGLGLAIAAVLGGFGAVISGLVMTRGEVLGSGYEKYHHFFVWPAFSVCVALVTWRLVKCRRTPPPNLGFYLVGMSVASALTMGAGFWGGEMLLGATAQKAPAFASTPTQAATAGQTSMVAAGRQLFLMNCAHCHAPDATGDEGPNLHRVKKSDARIAATIKGGVKGEMPKFESKLSDGDVQSLIAYIHSLN